MAQALSFAGAAFLLASCATGRELRLAEHRAALRPGTLERLQSEFLAQPTATLPVRSLAFWRDGEPVVEWTDGAPAEALFDMASLAKPLAAVPVAARLLSETPGDAEALRRLLMHRSGLPAEFTLREAQSIDLDATWIAAQNALRTEPCDRYTNAGAFVLSALHERRHLDTTASWLRDHFWGPAQTSSLTFAPPPGSIVVNAHAEDTTTARAFDPVADWMLRERGWAPLHSGLFGTASDAARAMSWLLYATPQDSSERWRTAELLFSAPEPAPACDDRKRIVWRTRGGLETDARGRFLQQTGYTGCVLWVDRETRTVLVFLTNATATNGTADFERTAAALTATLRNGILER